MVFAGLQKLTLLDFPGKTACTVFTRGCNYRCPFCHNASLASGTGDDGLTENELLEFLRKRSGLLEGLVVSGGEPLLNSELPDFLEKVRVIGYAIKIDTNGTRPEMLRKIVADGFADYIAMDIKNSLSCYPAATGTENSETGAVNESIDFLLSGAVPYEFRTTVVKGIHTAEMLIDAAKRLEGAEAWYLQQYKDSGDIISGAGLSAFDEKEMHALADTVRRYVPSVSLRGV